ncbi:MAG: hypothetical protein HDQ99_02885 [Lachnospiraceae bacterium]|nr:hypothetical protein [Lachnospiraceae bacterium]
MKVLEKILDEIENYGKYKGVLKLEKNSCDNWLPVKEIKRILRSHMNEEWILVGQSLPKENKYVRVTTWCGHEWIGFYRDCKWFVYSLEGLSEATVIAWQPTHPYKAKEDA